MTLFDLMLINKYRSRHPHTEDLVAAIARWCGVYKPPDIQEEIPITSVPDPRAAIKKAFAGTKFKDLEGIPNVL